MAAGGDSSLTSSPWAGLLLMLVFGPLVGGFGLALARNFRGVTEWHVRKAFQVMRPVAGPLSRVPPWKQMAKRSVEDRIRRQIKVERVMGVAFAGFGGVMIVGGVAAFVAWLV